MYYSIAQYITVYYSTAQYVTVHVVYHTAVYYLKENLALVTEGAMQQNCQTTYKLLETNLAILQWGRRKEMVLNKMRGIKCQSFQPHKIFMRVTSKYGGLIVVSLGVWEQD